MVSHSPGSCGSAGLGNMDIDVIVGIWRDKDNAGLRCN